jgi:uncharacterized protein
VGELVNHSEWSRILGISASSVADYVAILEETHIVATVRPYIGGKRAELTQAPKAFFVDNGLRNALAGGFEPLDRRADVGKLLENWVFSELHKRYPDPGGVRYWRTRNGAEVDFVLEPVAGDVLPIEVKASAGASGPSRSLRSFLEAYHPRRAWIVHRGERKQADVDGVEVAWIPAEALPEALQAL